MVPNKRLLKRVQFIYSAPQTSCSVTRQQLQTQLQAYQPLGGSLWGAGFFGASFSMPF